MRASHIIATVIALALLGTLAYCAQRRLVEGLPPKAELPTLAEAHAAALAYQHANGGNVLPILGTGSMAPFIPPARAGLDPWKTVVAYVVTDPRATFADVRAGSLCIYLAAWNRGGPVLHQAAERDGGGWIMSGLNNAQSEADWRVTPENFRGVAAKVFTWPQE